MPFDDTIAAPATPPGRSARAMIRVSGPAVRGVLAALCPDAGEGRGAGASRLTLPGGPSLPVLLLRFAGPASYTGEDVAEVLLPGNPRLVERVMDAVLAYPGVRRAGPGEFTARAYLNGRMTLEQAEGVAAVIAARNEKEINAAGRLLSGAAGGEYRRWAEGVATLSALVEAGIDFSDQDSVTPISRGDLRARTGEVAAAIERRLGAAAGSEVRPTLPRVVLSGAPNAGKSTLFNALLGRARSVVSAAAGTTRDVIEEELDLSRDVPGAGRITLADAAGVETARRERGGAEGGAQAAASLAAREADALIWCDPTGAFDEGELARRIGARPARAIRVRTKADLPPGPGGRGREDVAVCALDGWNMGVLRRAIADAAAGADLSGAAGVIPRHRRALADAAARLREVGAAGGFETAAASLRLALDSLGDVTGRIAPDEVIGRIFATFCVGK